MNNNNLVIFKGRKNGITIALDENANFEKLKEALANKTEEAREFFGSVKTGINFTGRELNEEQESQLLDIIKNTSDLSISFVTNEEEEVLAYVEAPEEESEIFEILPDQNMTYFYRGSLRSGQSISYPGSVVVIGDVNPGAEIIAEGNVIVMGSIKGLAHAGSMGNPECFVAALDMAPTQMRISDIITYIPKELTKKNKNIPSYAYVKDGQVYVIPLNKRPEKL